MFLQDVLGALIWSYAAGHISDKAFPVLQEEYQSVNLCFPSRGRSHFNLTTWIAVHVTKTENSETKKTETANKQRQV